MSWLRPHPHYYIVPTSVQGWLIIILYFGLIYGSGRLILNGTFESLCAYFLLVSFYTAGLLFLFYWHNEHTS